MRAVVQRVASASVSVEGKAVSSIGKGLLVLLGVGRGDGERDFVLLADKIVHLRIFEDAEGKMNRSVQEEGGELLVVSQFTLYGDASKGRQPSFVEAMEPEGANRLYEAFCAACRRHGVKVSEGIFRAHMQVALVNDGPVTLLVDTRK
jgi:D-tyrosyl-tRNA(Tyr) deacylase